MGQKGVIMTSKPTGVQRKTNVTTIFGTILVSSVRGQMGKVSLNETCIFLPETLATLRGNESEVIGTYDDHEKIVDAIRFTMPHVGQ